MMPDWNPISTRVTQIIEVLHLGDEPLACTALDHCQRRAAGEPADEAGEDQLIEFAANYGQSLDWIVLGDLDPTIRRLSAIGHDGGYPAVRTAVTTTESDLAGGPCDDLTRIGGIPGIGLRQYAGRHDRHASDSTEMGVRRLEAR